MHKTATDNKQTKILEIIESKIFIYYYITNCAFELSGYCAHST